MPNYQYTGCVTGVSESDQIQLIQPNESPIPVVRDANAYTERLVGVALLLDETISCTPSQAILNGVWGFGTGFNFRYLTVSKNGGAPETFDVSEMSAEQQSLFVSQNLYLAADGISYAFMDSSAIAIPPVVETDGTITLAASGFDISGNAIFFGTPYNFIGRTLTPAENSYTVNEMVAETNTIEIHRTVDTLLSEDAYSYYKTTEENDKPVVLYSCAKAIVGAMAS